MTAAAAVSLQVAPTLLDFYHLHEQPFGVTPDPAYLYLSRTHREALTSLLSGIKADRGFLALIAEPGMGKTTLLYQLMEELGDSACAVFLFQTQCDIRQFIQYVLSELGFDTQGMGLVALHRRLNEVLFNEMLAGKRFVLIVDESQNLRGPVLETIRMLSNFETPHAKLLQIVLAGQSELAGKLAQPSLTQLRQRIAVVNHLARLTPAESACYVEHRLKVAGYSGKGLFTSDALALVAQSSQGIPRNINTICFDAISAAHSRGRSTITSEIILDVVTRADVGTLAGLLSPAEERVAGDSLPVIPQLSYEPVMQFRPLRWAFRKVHHAQTEARPISRRGRSADLTDPRSRPNEATRFRFGFRSTQMTKAAVARATILGPVNSERSVAADSPVVVASEGTRAGMPLVPQEDDLRLAARMRALASETDRVFLFAGVTAPEGVDDVAAGVASALAQIAQEQVLLVDADLRVPSLHARFGVNLSPGLSELRAVTINGDGFHLFGNCGVSLLTAGNTANPMSLFSSKGFSALMNKLREEYRFIVLKSPPILSAAEVHLLVRSADGVVLIVPQGKQRKPEVAEAKKALADLKAKVMGAVLCQKAARGSSGRA